MTKHVGDSPFLHARDVPYLVQRVLRRVGEGPGKGVDRHFSFDYMGSSEFEWGALPAALQEMRKHELTMHSIQHETYACTFVGRAEDVNKALAFFIDQLGEHRKIRLKEWSAIRAAFVENNNRTCAWWAIDQDCPWLLFRDEADAQAWLKAMGT